MLRGILNHLRSEDIDGYVFDKDKPTKLETIDENRPKEGPKETHCLNGWGTSINYEGWVIEDGKSTRGWNVSEWADRRLDTIWGF